MLDWCQWYIRGIFAKKPGMCTTGYFYSTAYLFSYVQCPIRLHFQSFCCKKKDGVSVRTIWRFQKAPTRNSSSFLCACSCQYMGPSLSQYDYAKATSTPTSMSTGRNFCFLLWDHQPFQCEPFTPNASKWAKFSAGLLESLWHALIGVCSRRRRFYLCSGFGTCGTFTGIGLRRRIMNKELA